MVETQNLEKLPIDRKLLLSFSEAAEYTHIGRNKLRMMAKIPTCSFAFHNGSTTLIKRNELEEYIKKNRCI